MKFPLKAILYIYYFYLFMQSCKHNLSWLASYIHACTNETHSIAILQGLICTLAAIIISCTYVLASQSRDYVNPVRICFIYVCMDVTS